VKAKGLAMKRKSRMSDDVQIKLNIVGLNGPFGDMPLTDRLREILPPECDVTSRISSDGNAFIVIEDDATELTEHVRLSFGPFAEGSNDPEDQM
jgi:hypothetical protein